MNKEQFIKKANIVHGKKYDYSRIVLSDTVVSRIVCAKHGEFSQSLYDHLRGHECAKCGRAQGALSKIRSNALAFIERAHNVHGQKYDYSKVEYVGSKKKVCIVCPEHGEFWQRPEAHIHRGQGCPKCGKLKTGSLLRSNTTEFVKKARIIHGQKYDYSKVKYKSSHKKVCIVCKEHGEFWQQPNDHLSKHGCSKCSNVGISGLEMKVVHWLEKQGILVKTQQRLDGGRQTLDVFLPEFNLGIEINGLYWHSEKFVAPTYHQEKSSNAENHKISLLHFWEHQINNKAAIVKSMLRIRLNRAKLRIFARECQLCQIDMPTAVEFLNKNHLQGSASARVAYGLFLDKKLVAVMTLGKPRFNKAYEWEIIRLATLRNTIVVGGASKLFTAFVRDVKPKNVISYADLDYADGGVYKNLGFKLTRYSKPSYFWTRGNSAIPRYKAQKHKLLSLLGDEFDANLSERENMENAGYFRVFNSGNAVFTWTPDNLQKERNG